MGCMIPMVQAPIIDPMTIDYAHAGRLCREISAAFSRVRSGVRISSALNLTGRAVAVANFEESVYQLGLARVVAGVRGPHPELFDLDDPDIATGLEAVIYAWSRPTYARRSLTADDLQCLTDDAIRARAHFRALAEMFEAEGDEDRLLTHLGFASNAFGLFWDDVRHRL